MNKMRGVLGHNSALLGYSGWAESVMKHAPGAGSITWPMTSSPVHYHYATDAPHQP